MGRPLRGASRACRQRRERWARCASRWHQDERRTDLSPRCSLPVHCCRWLVGLRRPMLLLVAANSRMQLSVRERPTLSSSARTTSTAREPPSCASTTLASEMDTSRESSRRSSTTPAGGLLWRACSSDTLTSQSTATTDTHSLMRATRSDSFRRLERARGLPIAPSPLAAIALPHPPLHSQRSTARWMSVDARVQDSMRRAVAIRAGPQRGAVRRASCRLPLLPAQFCWCGRISFPPCLSALLHCACIDCVCVLLLVT